MNILKYTLPTLMVALLVFVGCKREKYDFNALPDTVKSFFTVTNGAEELHINKDIGFVNESENAQTYFWDFGDGTTSTEENPTKRYVDPGVYTVKLKVIGEGGTGNYSIDLAVIDPDAVVDTDKELYFIEYGSKLVRKVSLVLGSVPETVANMTGKEGHGMTYDSVNDKIYYCDFQTTGAGKIIRMNSDGTNVEELLTGLYSPYGIAVNVAAGKMYIVDGANVSRANLDGSGYEKEFITIEGGLMRAIGFNSQSNLIYFYEVNDENLYVAKEDGTGVAPIIQDAYGYGLFIDEVNEKIYYDDRRNTGLMQANLDGSGAVKIADFSGNRGGSGVSIDYHENKLYWSETNLGNIKRANLDGSEVETILSGVNNPRGMFIK